jgi:hypothetical protein
MDLRTRPDEPYTLGQQEQEPAGACADDSFHQTGVAAWIRSGGISIVVRAGGEAAKRTDAPPTPSASDAARRPQRWQTSRDRSGLNEPKPRDRARLRAFESGRGSALDVGA